MSTTSRGYPLFSLTDNADIAAKLNAISQALDKDLTGWFSPRMKRVARAGAGMAVPDSSSTQNWATFVGFNTTTIQIGPAIAYTGGVYTVDFTGVAEVSLYVKWPVVTAAHRTLARILQNGAETDDGLDSKWYPSGTNGQTAQKIVSQMRCASGDTFSSQVWQDSGATVTTVADTAVFTIRRIA